MSQSEEAIKVCTQQFDIRKYSESENLLSREQGQQILEGIKEELTKLPVEGILFLDFRNIHCATYACLTEILSVVNGLKRGEFRDKYLIMKLESINHDLKDSLIFVIKEKNSVILSLDEKGNKKVLGKLTKAQSETREIVRKREEVTSTEISKLFDIPISAASNRLKDLYDKKLLRREERILTTGGREFVYRCVLC